MSLYVLPGSPCQSEFEDFCLPFEGKLKSENRWVKLAKKIPWDEFEQAYRQNFSESGLGPGTKSVQMALGALIIKERLNLSDREAVDLIQENPYLQYFLGLSRFQGEAPFDASMFVHFRKRFSQEDLQAINERIVEKANEAPDSKDITQSENDQSPSDQSDQGQGEKESLPNNGQLLIDATCTPADIAYPTDLGLLDRAREKSEAIIDKLHGVREKGTRKPRTYRQKARKLFLNTAKRKAPGKKRIRKAIRRQLSYLKRNLSSIKTLADEVGLSTVSKSEYRELLVVSEVYRQQKEMYDAKSNKTANRIVSISQPHVRPIVRGKARAKIEFGAKISVSLINGYSFVDRISFDAYGEGADLSDQAESYKKRFGTYPASIHADQIYRTRANIDYCKTHSIRLSGPALGRPRKVTAENSDELKELRRQSREDEVARIPIEGKFGEGKRRYGLGLISSKLTQTSITSISMCFIVMNLEKWLKSIFHALLHRLWVLVQQAKAIVKPHIPHIRTAS